MEGKASEGPAGQSEGGRVLVGGTMKGGVGSVGVVHGTHARGADELIGRGDGLWRAGAAKGVMVMSEKVTLAARVCCSFLP